MSTCARHVLQRNQYLDFLHHRANRICADVHCHYWAVEKNQKAEKSLSLLSLPYAKRHNKY